MRKLLIFIGLLVLFAVVSAKDSYGASPSAPVKKTTYSAPAPVKKDYLQRTSSKGDS
jgi:hypothetical protein